MSENTPEVSQKAGLRKILLPLSIGIGLSLYFFLTTFKPGALSSIHFTQRLLPGLILAAIAVAVRDFSFMYKLRLSVGKKLSWKKTFQAIIMWEYGATITPKVGEVAFTLFVLKRSGLSYGRSTAAIMLNTFLDTLAFVVVFGGLYIMMGHQILTVSTDCPNLTGHTVIQAVRDLANNAWIGYVIFCAIALLFGVGLFILPHTAKNFFYRLANIKILNRFQNSLRHLGDEMEITAHEYKNEGPGFWLKMSTATLVNWTARYLLVNALLWGFSSGSLPMFQIFARQYLLWIFLVIPSTPGAAGVAEVAFMALNCEFMPFDFPTALAITTVWRIYSYYLYLVLGAIVMPWWQSTNPVQQKSD
ncbi:MAG: hypothetical protein JWO06_301 [Bacteroidota bacterium]|nr:hypothetical protein [Bacteroidota bacterium]